MIKLTKPFIPESCIENVIRVIKSGNLVQGEYVKKLEYELCNYLKIKNAILVSNGTAALHLALLAFNIGKDDEVIVPAFTFPATSNVVELVGAKTVLVDINLSDYCMNTSIVRKSITSKTKAILPVHEFGQAVKMDELIKIAKEENLIIIEDAACALGAEYMSKKVGTLGDIGCFSFHPRKAITTGEGGVLVTNNDSIADKIRSLRNHGIIYNNSNLLDFKYPGLNYRLTDFQAALGIGQLEVIENIINKRQEIAERYDIGLADVHWLKVPNKFNERKMVYQSYHILVDKKINRDELILYLKNNKIETNFGAYALNLLLYYKNKYGFSDTDFPNASLSYKNGIVLPLSYELNDEEIDFIINKIKEYSF